jgi:hypothetical protein
MDFNSINYQSVITDLESILNRKLTEEEKNRIIESLKAFVAICYLEMRSNYDGKS